MAGLHAYLADIHTPVDTLTLAAPEAREAALSTGYGQGSGTNQGMHQNADQGVPSQSPLNPLRDSPRAEEDFTESIPGLSPAVAAGASSSESTGTHISVMA
jgi:hypothetical protein